MARYRGDANVNMTYDISYWGPFDTRMLVPEKADLTIASTWIPLRHTESCAYDGMIVAVGEDKVAENNGIYYLKDYTRVTSDDAWVKLAEISQIDELKEMIKNIPGGTGGVTEAQVDEKIEQLRSELLAMNFITEETLTNKLEEIDSINYCEF